MQCQPGKQEVGISARAPDLCDRLAGATLSALGKLTANCEQSDIRVHAVGNGVKDGQLRLIAWQLMNPCGRTGLLPRISVDETYYPGNKEGHIPTRSASEGPMKSSESRRGSPLDD